MRTEGVPAHTATPPLALMTGTVYTVTTAVEIHPIPYVYVIVDVPAATPVTTPDEEPTVTLPLLLLHVPPGDWPVSVVEKPSHVSKFPVICSCGRMFTVAVLVEVIPLPSVT